MIALLRQKYDEVMASSGKFEIDYFPKNKRLNIYCFGNTLK